MLAFWTQSVSLPLPKTEPAVDRSLFSIAWPTSLSLYTTSWRYPAIIFHSSVRKNKIFPHWNREFSAEEGSLKIFYYSTDKNWCLWFHEWRNRSYHEIKTWVLYLTLEINMFGRRNMNSASVTTSNLKLCITLFPKLELHTCSHTWKGGIWCWDSFESHTWK